MSDVVLAGVGMTPFGKFPAATNGSLARAAVAEALADAGVEPPAVEAVFAGNAVAGLITGQEMVRAQVALAGSGIAGVPFFNVENACASASSALHLAVRSVASGQYDCVLALGVEKMTHPDKARSFAAIGTAVDVEAAAAAVAAGGGAPKDRSPFMDLYAAETERSMETLGAEVADFAAVSVKNHAHGARNPRAQYGSEVTLEEVLGSRMVVPPLTLLMCSPIGDGAAAAVVLSAGRARELGVGTPVRVLASVVRSGDPAGRMPPAPSRAATAAYDEAGVGPDDLDVVEVHDAAAPAELAAYATLGLAGTDSPAALLRSGATRLGGRVPVNPSGGLLARGHPIGATGIAQVVELVDQLRGRAGDRQVPGARVALAHNNGGVVGADAAAATIHVLAR